MQKIDIGHLYEQRMLVFIENDPQSNEYEQIIFTSEQYKQLTKFVFDMFGKKGITIDGMEITELKASEDAYTLPDLQSYETRS